MLTFKTFIYFLEIKKESEPEPKPNDKQNTDNTGEF
jgi:hypothetical protein